MAKKCKPDECASLGDYIRLYSVYYMCCAVMAAHRRLALPRGSRAMLASGGCYWCVGAERPCDPRCPWRT